MCFLAKLIIEATICILLTLESFNNTKSLSTKLSFHASLAPETDSVFNSAVVSFNNSLVCSLSPSAVSSKTFMAAFVKADILSTSVSDGLFDLVCALIKAFFLELTSSISAIKLSISSSLSLFLTEFSLSLIVCVF